MATFTTEEIELLKNRGNDYCKRVWLGLYDGTPHNDPREEQTIRDFMVDKYERKRYYIDPQNVTVTNGYNLSVENNKSVTAAPLINQQQQQKKRPNEKLVDFVADFSSADIFSAVNNNSSDNGSTQQQQTTSFANFDNNPVFNSTSKYC